MSDAVVFSFSLTPTQRGELQAHLKSRNLPLGIALRMRIILMLDEGASYSHIKEKLDTTGPTISLWKRRYREAVWLAWSTSMWDSRPRY
jgi:hypothetical protein